MATDWLVWRINRLRCMSLREIAHRSRRAVAAYAERWGVGQRSRVPPADLTRSCVLWMSVPAAINRAAHLAAADRLVAGNFDVFALHDAYLGSPPRWNRDPKSGIEAPLSFGKLIDYRDPQKVGDIKYLWEINRHRHLVTLAQAYALSQDAKYFSVIRQHLDDWFIHCPCGWGPNWASALEAGIRLINWSLSWQLLGGAHAAVFADEPGAQFRQRWLDSVYQHAQFIRGFFSLFSSANNHLIGEVSGLFIAALTWPHWPQAESWRREAQALLEREARLQNASDGVNREQSVSYQQYEIDLLVLPWLAARACGFEFSGGYVANIERMLEYMASVMDVRGHVPMFGDSDDGLVFKLEQSTEDCRYRSSLATGAILFERPDFMSKAGRLDDKTRWLLGGLEKSTVLSQRALSDAYALPVRRAFPEGGYFILGCDFERENEIRMVVDCGPLGYQSIAAHGHADALSFVLSVGGQEFLIDPGTYAYHTRAPWRQYFRGTSAHNTLRVDGEDQSRPGGNFMWLTKAEACCSHWHVSATDDVFEGWHDGYQRLADPVIHRRRIVLDKMARRFHIEDHLQMKGMHTIELLFHCAEGCHVERTREGYALSYGARQLRLNLPMQDNATSRAWFGSNDPIFGWVSRHFDDRQATTTIVWSARLSGDHILRSGIEC